MLRLLGAANIADAEHKLRNILAGRDMALRLVDEQKERIAAFTAEVEELTALDASMRETITYMEESAEKRERELFENARCRSVAEETVERHSEYIATLEQLAKPDALVFDPFDSGTLDSDKLVGRLVMFFSHGTAPRRHLETAAYSVLGFWKSWESADNVMRAIGWSGK